MFCCRHRTADTIGWSVNDVTLLSELRSMNINISGIDVFPDMSVQNTLTLIALSERNGSRIKCFALFSDAPAEFSPVGVMLIQGVLCIIVIVKLEKALVNTYINFIIKVH